MTIVATAGAINANCYCTELEAEQYMETRLHTDNYDDASDDDIEYGLLWATRLLDTLCAWDGQKATDTQALRWPRTFIWDPDGDPVDSDTIPQFLKDATAEYMLHLIGSDRTQTFDPSLIGFERLKVGPLDMTMATQGGGQSKRSMIPESVWILVRQYCSRVGGRQKTTIRI